MTDLRRSSPDSLDVAREAFAGLARPWSLWLILGIQAALLVFHLTSSWHAGPDSALYMGLARSLATGAGYVFNYEPHVMVPPLFPVFLAGLGQVAGSSYLIYNITQIVLALACTPVAFWMLRQSFGKDLAVAGTTMFALNLVLWKAASMIISDVLFTLLAFVAMGAVIHAARGGRWRWPVAMAAAIAVAAASLTRTNGLVMAPAAALALWLGWRGRPWAERLAVAAAFAAVAFGPMVWWTRYAASVQSGEGGTYLAASHLARPLGQMLPAMARNVFHETVTETSNTFAGFSDVPIGLNFLAPIAIGVGCAVSLRRREVLFPVTILLMVALLATVPGIRARYLLFVLPAATVLLIVGVAAVVRQIARERHVNARVLGAALITALAVMVAGNVIHTVDKGISYRKGTTPNASRLERDQGWFVAGQYIADHHTGDRPPVVLTRQASVVHYLTGAKTHNLKQRRAMTQVDFEHRIDQARPQWLLAEPDEPRTALARRAFEALGVELLDVGGATGTNDIVLWQAFYPPG